MFGKPLRLALLFAALLAVAWALQNVNQSRSAALLPASSAVAGGPVALAAPETEHAFRILLGLTDTTSTRWDGGLTISGGALARIEPWRFDMQDAFGEQSATGAQWRVATHPIRLFAGQNAQANPPIVANGVVATFANVTSASEVAVKIAQGEFSFKPTEIGYGQRV